ncbi:MAG: PAS domain-containing protein [Candidatus Kapabacteria bacterium]|nr:PAS domain-containing protein [Candidatus Kapabacteria bacterium]
MSLSKANKQYVNVLQQVKYEFLSNTIYQQRAFQQIKHEIHDLLASQYDAADIGVYAFDISATTPSDYFIYINPAIEKLTGYTREELQRHGARLVLSRFKAEELPRIIEFHNDYFRKIYSLPHEEALSLRYYIRNSFCRKDGTWLEVQGSGQPLSMLSDHLPQLLFCTLQLISNDFVYIGSPQHLIEQITLPESTIVNTEKLDDSDTVHSIINSSIQAHVEELAQHVFSPNEEYHWQYREALRFMKTLLTQCSTLSPTEVKICFLMHKHIASMKIVEILGLSMRTFENHRSRIRKKLGLQKHTSLSAFMIGLKMG